mmetsp:Transcript_23989/g.65409  ORF Transcript_23989/g.65409 Transcript_23989/m.65409 type:complete len:201 (+) Transcript_23989:460-1062(+)
MPVPSCWPPGGPKGKGTGGACGGRIMGIVASCAAVGGCMTVAMGPGRPDFLPKASASRTFSTLPSVAMPCSMPLRELMQLSASLKEVKVTKAHGFESVDLAKIFVWVTKPYCWQTSRTVSSVTCVPMLPMKTLGCCCDLPLGAPFTSANFTLMPSPRPPSIFRPFNPCIAASAAAHVEKEQNAQPLPSRTRKFVAPYGAK